MSGDTTTQLEDARAMLVGFLGFLESQPARVVSRLVKYTHGDVHFSWTQLMAVLESGQFMQYLQDQPSDHSDQTELEFRVFYDLYLLRDLLIKTPLQELLLLLSVVHSDNLAQRISQIEGVYGVLTQLGPAAISEIHNALTQPAEDQQALIFRLREFLSLDDQHYHLYQTLVTLFQQDKASLNIIANTLAFLTSSQLAILPRLTPLSPEEIQDIVNIFHPPEQVTTGVTVDIGGQSNYADSSAPSFTLTVTEQPPDRCVYKRNVKPGPTVVVQGGGESELESNIWMCAILTRCDTEEDCPGFLIGASPQRLTPSRTFEWKRLKVMVTSHQQNETMFSLRFELRVYPEGASAEDQNSPFEVLTQVSTNPILVLSHSTQLRTPVEALPSVTEVVPASGTTAGFTRVAILGKDFVESPTTRVKFGTTEVTPSFHGPKTLICRTPSHVSGRVEVRVCNDVNGWSQTFGHFFFDSHLHEHTVHSPSGTVAFETGFETARVVQHR